MIANTSSFCFTFSNPKLISAVFSALCHSCFDALLELFGFVTGLLFDDVTLPTSSPLVWLEGEF